MVAKVNKVTPVSLEYPLSVFNKNSTIKQTCFFLSSSLDADLIPGQTGVDVLFLASKTLPLCPSVSETLNSVEYTTLTDCDGLYLFTRQIPYRFFGTLQLQLRYFSTARQPTDFLLLFNFFEYLATRIIRITVTNIVCAVP